MQFVLSGQHESNPNGSTGWGLATVTANTDTREVSIFLTYGNLLGAPTLAAVYGLAPEGVDGTVLFQLSHVGDHFTGTATLSEAYFAGFMQNLTYINLHSEHYADGEVRAQMIIPAPGALALAGVAALCSRRRRR
jgi:hypothetical protein